MNYHPKTRTVNGRAVTVYMTQMYGRCIDCNYGVDIESVSATSASSRMGTALMQHTQKNPAHTVKVTGQAQACTTSEHMDAAISAVACKCQVG